MNNRPFFTCFLLVTICLSSYSQVILAGKNGDTPLFTLTGELTGMATIGFEDETQVINYQNNIKESAQGIYDQKFGKNGYFTGLNFGLLFSPVSAIDVYAKFLIRYRPGSPYIPLQLIDAAEETFTVKLDAVYGRVNAVKGLGFDIPLDVWLKAGKYDTQAANFQKVSKYGSEMILQDMRTGTDYSLQMEAAYPFFNDSVLSLAVTANQKFGDAVAKLYDEDGAAGTGIDHGAEIIEGDKTFSMHNSLKLKGFTLPFGAVSAELLYVINAEKIYSKNNIGLNAGLNINVLDNLSIPVGFAAALYGGNIDVMAGSALGRSNSDSLYMDTATDYGLRTNSHTASFREAFRAALAAGARYNISDDITSELNIGFAFSNIGHYYRDTISIASLSADLRIDYRQYFFGAGVFAGTLSDVEWKTKEDAESANKEAYSHTFKPAENLGYEIYGGIQFNNARFVIGYNNNKGISMNHSIESIPEAQTKYKQKNSTAVNNLFETGGLYTKLVISW